MREAHVIELAHTLAREPFFTDVANGRSVIRCFKKPILTLLTLSPQPLCFKMTSRANHLTAFLDRPGPEGYKYLMIIYIPTTCLTITSTKAARISKYLIVGYLGPLGQVSQLSPACQLKLVRHFASEAKYFSQRHCQSMAWWLIPME